MQVQIKKYSVLVLVIIALLGPQIWPARPDQAVAPVESSGQLAGSENENRTMIDSPAAAEIAKSPLPNGQVGRIPILMYHEISSGPDCMWVEVNDFRAQMQYLHDRGYQTLTLSQAGEMLAGHFDTSKMVVLTFDDGYDTFYNQAWPILEEFHQTATVFVITDLVGSPEYMNWEQIKHLASQGVEIGGHTCSHPLLPDLPDSGVQTEIMQGKKEIEAHIGVVITSFCYPTGKYNDQVVQTVKQAGFTEAVTMVQREASSADNLLLLPRWGVYKNDPLERFARLVQ